LEDSKNRYEFVQSQFKKHNTPLVIDFGGSYSPSVKTIVEAL